MIRIRDFQLRHHAAHATMTNSPLTVFTQSGMVCTERCWASFKMDYYSQRKQARNCMGSGFWWAKILIIGLFSVFLLIFGVEVLIGAYGLKQPHLFLMFFFSGSFIILVSLVGILYPVLQIYTFMTHKSDAPKND